MPVAFWDPDYKEGKPESVVKQDWAQKESLQENSMPESVPVQPIKGSCTKSKQEKRFGSALHLSRPGGGNRISSVMVLKRIEVTPFGHSFFRRVVVSEQLPARNLVNLLKPCRVADPSNR